MKDNFEKKIDKHYTYICKQSSPFNLKNNFNWYISRQEHEPNEKPTFESAVREIGFGLSEGSARAEVIELQLEEIKRRKRVTAQCFSFI